MDIVEARRIWEGAGKPLETGMYAAALTESPRRPATMAIHTIEKHTNAVSATAKVAAEDFGITILY